MNARFIIHVPSRDIKPISPLPQEGSWKNINEKSLCQGVRNPVTCHLCVGTQKRVEDSWRLPKIRGVQSHFERTLGFCLVVPPDVQWRQHSFQFLRALDNRLSFISRLFLKNQILVSPFVSLSLSAMAARVPSLVFLKVLFYFLELLIGEPRVSIPVGQTPSCLHLSYFYLFCSSLEFCSSRFHKTLSSEISSL